MKRLQTGTHAISRVGQRWSTKVVWVIPIIVCVAMIITPADASNVAQVRDGQLVLMGGDELWGFAWPHWQDLGKDRVEVRHFLKTYVVHGLNTIGFTLQKPGDKQPFFASDGHMADEQLAKRFSEFTGDVRGLYVATAISLFSADRSCWLASADAYRQAVHEVTALLPKNHGAILVLGDLSAMRRWPEDCPGRLGDPATLVALCTEAQKTRRDVLVAVPAAAVNPTDKKDLLYVASRPEAFSAWIDAVRAGADPSARTKQAAALTADRFLWPACLKSADYRQTLKSFSKHVEQLRLGIQPPPCSSSNSPFQLGDAERAEGFRLLFDGRSLEGWTILRDDWAGWVVEDGMIHCKGVQGPWLRTRQRFSDFILRIEFKIGPKGNSGVFLRAPLDGRCSQFGMEMQIRGLNGKLNDHDTTGAIYSAVPPMRDAANPPGHWNEAEITCRGDHVTVRVNGQLVQDFDMNQVPEMKDRLRCGFIGLQDHGDEVWFRNIRIKPLEGASRP